ncbi:L-ascorbate metabolism protein UlaG, beta-lactamase superfamily [Dehalogenimonas formicexedens]|uniref:L-ascorbate metabolism protein UlaG, beta-lactamase superfamily n=1 Tax=Dehalogenimonas formicexedens TaxID=1839801 RepID=A0A1P8F4W6_9CHLR|nr:MBL fold metallo-hydrolase [Dehalogenimonas formicexedens]APV43519.1 L-ascorbate metabolism protein UlaG, beta-lactamase superfamily [Dehalogenimonas formicexedens]
MEIKYLGHSCFRIKGKNTTVITDPFAPELGFTPGKQTANIVTVSHQHNGHNYTSGVSGEFRVVSRPGEYEIGDAILIGLPSFHDSEKGLLRGKNVIFVISVDDVVICHLGDLGEPLSESKAEELGNVDILLVPVGDMSALNANNAARLVRQIEPAIVIPMHYKLPQGTRELEPVEKFLGEMGSSGVVPQPKLVVTKANLPLPTQVVVLEAGTA